MNRIREIRKEKGLSQLELARKLNVNQTAVSQWERGTTLPSASVLLKLSSILDTSSDYLLGISNDPRSLIYEDQEIMDEVKEDFPILINKIVDKIENLDASTQKDFFDTLVELRSLLNSDCDKQKAVELMKENIISINRVFNNSK